MCSELRKKMFVMAVSFCRPLYQFTILNTHSIAWRFRGKWFLSWKKKITSPAYLAITEASKKFFFLWFFLLFFSSDIFCRYQCVCSRVYLPWDTKRRCYNIVVKLLSSLPLFLPSFVVLFQPGLGTSIFTPAHFLCAWVCTCLVGHWLLNPFFSLYLLNPNTVFKAGVFFFFSALVMR